MTKTPLHEKIEHMIKSGGPMTFERFMETALYDPENGYYMSEDIMIGWAGDFYTSPHLHPAFGAMLGRQMIEFWDFMGKPAGFTIVEMGAGHCYLAKDMLDYLKGKEIYDCIEYLIVEISPRLRQFQKDNLSGHTSKARWIPSLASAGRIKGCLLTNELLDAFPVHLVKISDGLLKEIYVSVDGEGFVEVPADPSSDRLIEYFTLLDMKLPDGYKTEINLRMKDWVLDVGTALDEGFVLTIDYGYTTAEYFDEDRSRGTLLCYHEHGFDEDPYSLVGQKDMTAHVNFSDLKRWGEEAGLRTLGYCPQGTYLVALGLDELITELYDDSPDYLAEVSKIKGLILPGTMGDTHSVMIQYKGSGSPLPRGFSIRNQLRYL